ncbi:MAG: hypothetical protein KJ630_17890 [Proteobacteria bacterium]|nr:hypothetical protein [Pseudomonadota bacterium]
MIVKIKKFLQNILLQMARKQVEFWVGMVVRARPDWSPRQWSNRELLKLSGLFTGDIINVGAWRDEDKEGNFYKLYFSNAKTYTKTNYSGEDGLANLPDELFLDLSVPLYQDFKTYDLVFTHTVLEHVHPLSIAFDNVCNLSRDCVLAVVPFIQCFHGRDGSYGDYTRFTPMLLEELFRKRGFEVVYLNWNDDFPVMNVYVIVLATRFPNRWQSKVPQGKRAVVGKVGPGMQFNKILWGDGSKKSGWRRAGEFVGASVHVEEKRKHYK